MQHIEEEFRAEESEDFKPLRLDIDDDGSNSDQQQHATTNNNTNNNTADGSATGSGRLTHGNLFIAGLPPNSSEASVGALLKPFGEFDSLRVVPERHFAFVQLKTAEAAAACIAKLAGTRLQDATAVLHVAPAMHSEATEEPPNARLFIRGLPPFASEATLRTLAAPFGAVQEASVVVFPDGRCKGSGFVTFVDVAESVKCHAALNDAPQRIALGESAGATLAVKLTARFSETAEAREARQRRNRERIAERASQGQTPPVSHRAGGGGAAGHLSAVSSARNLSVSTSARNLSTVPSSLQPVPSTGPPPPLSAGNARTRRSRGGMTGTPWPHSYSHHQHGSAPPDSPHPPSAAVAFGAAMTAQHAPPPVSISPSQRASAISIPWDSARNAPASVSGTSVSVGGTQVSGPATVTAQRRSPAAAPVAAPALTGSGTPPQQPQGRPQQQQQSSQGTLVLCNTTPAFPRTGDVFIGPMGVIKGPEAVVDLVSNVAEPPAMVAPYRAKSGETGFAFRLRNAEHVQPVVEALNGASFLGAGAAPVSCWQFA